MQIITDHRDHFVEMRLVGRLDNEWAGHLNDAIDEAIRGAQAVVISDYAKGVVTHAIAQHAIRAARAGATMLTACLSGTRRDLTDAALLRVFLIPGLAVLPLTYFSLYHSGGSAFNWGIALSGLLVVAQFSYFGEFLPKVFPLHLRGTGGSFATNVGGRMVGTSAAFLTTQLAAKFGGSTFDQVATAAGLVGTAVFVLGLILSFALPEPAAEAASD